jgi:hypothetical protein
MSGTADWSFRYSTAVVLPSLIWGPRMPTLEGIVKDVSAGRFAWLNRGKPPLTRQMVRMVGYDFTLSDQRARAELGYSPVVGRGNQSHADGATRLRFPS